MYLLPTRFTASPPRSTQVECLTEFSILISSGAAIAEVSVVAGAATPASPPVVSQVFAAGIEAKLGPGGRHQLHIDETLVKKNMRNCVALPIVPLVGI